MLTSWREKHRPAAGQYAAFPRAYAWHPSDIAAGAGETAQASRSFRSTGGTGGDGGVGDIGGDGGLGEAGYIPQEFVESYNRLKVNGGIGGIGGIGGDGGDGMYKGGDGGTSQATIREAGQRSFVYTGGTAGDGGAASIGGHRGIQGEGGDISLEFAESYNHFKPVNGGMRRGRDGGTAQATTWETAQRSFIYTGGTGGNGGAASIGGDGGIGEGGHIPWEFTESYNQFTVNGGIGGKGGDGTYKGGNGGTGQATTLGQVLVPDSLGPLKDPNAKLQHCAGLNKQLRDRLVKDGYETIGALRRAQVSDLKEAGYAPGHIASIRNAVISELQS